MITQTSKTKLHSSDSNAVRIGAVQYLNSRPLIQDLQSLVPECPITLDYPSRLADSLRKGDLDVALIPSIEYFRQPGCQIISDACVAARGEVMSVKLYCRVHPGEIRTLALDEGSRTSATLARVILAERFGVTPRTEPLSMESLTSDSEADAVLLIGDRAMHSPKETFHSEFDLGQMWYEWTGLPFVFAMWVAHADCDTARIATALSESRDRGVANVESISQSESARLGLSADTAFRYLTENLHYKLTSAERSGLRLFYDLASMHNLVVQNANIVVPDFVTA